MSPLSRIRRYLGGLRQPSLERLQRDRHAGGQQDDRFRQVFHASSDSIVIVRLDNAAYVEVNEGYERLSGYARVEVIGQIARADAWIFGDGPVHQSRQALVSFGVRG